MRMRARPTVAERFWARVSICAPNECWKWNGYFKITGYGVAYDGKRLMGAHRLAYILRNGAVAKGVECRHTCDNRACVNPAHIVLGTHSENMEDMVTRARSCRGENKPDAKLTEDAVKAIRARFGAGGITKAALAREYGVCADTIRDVVTRHRWAHVA